MSKLIYHIAGPADDEDYAQAEYLGEMLMTSLKGVDCVLHCVLPEDWTDFVSQQAATLGCKQRAPLVWLASGVVVGGLPEFLAECDKKYGLTTRGIEYSKWPKVAAENLANARAKASGKRMPPIGEVGTGAERGLAVSEALLLGNMRYMASSAETTGGPSELSHGITATVLALTPLPQPAHELLGCRPGAVFVVPCTPAGVDVLAAGNVEHGIMGLGSKALLVIGSLTDDLPVYVQAARNALLAKDAPLDAAQDAVLAGMMPALSRALSVAPPRASTAEVDALCLEEWIRDSADELLRCSVVLSELHARGGMHLERLVCAADGALSVL